MCVAGPLYVYFYLPAVACAAAAAVSASLPVRNQVLPVTVLLPRTVFLTVGRYTDSHYRPCSSWRLPAVSRCQCEFPSVPHGVFIPVGYTRERESSTKFELSAVTATLRLSPDRLLIKSEAVGYIASRARTPLCGITDSTCFNDPLPCGQCSGASGSSPDLSSNSATTSVV